ncbi:MAG: DEAD/DEAH box helicase [Thermoanaerobaculia bacterium]
MTKETITTGFASLGLNEKLLNVLTALGYEEPTPVQSAAIPPLLEKRDVLAQAATGTGKTAAFALPIIHRIALLPAGRTSPAALILVPTRELAMQVADATHRYGKELGIRVLPVYGGASMDTQLRALKRGVDVVVATPGRALDHINRKTLKLEDILTVVLDEADEMLDMGFAEDLEAILRDAPAGRQTALFSATLPPRISKIAASHLKNPVPVSIAREGASAGSMPKIRQTAFVVPRAHKLPALSRILDMEAPTAALVFCRTRNEVDELTETLNGRGHRAEAIHGGMSQEQRDRVMKKFRAGTAELLIATDVAARGLDIKHLSHVFNYDVPSSPEVYVHRIGRTGRAGREGIAITLAEPREHWQLKNIEKLTKQKISTATVPTVADLKARRLDITRASLREALIEGGLEHFRVVVDSLAEEFDPMEIAAAAVKLLHAESGGAASEEKDIPTIRIAPPAPFRAMGQIPSNRPRPFNPSGPPTRERERPTGPPPPRDGNVVRIFVGAGRDGNVRPGDLVGAITNEAGIDPRLIGAIQIADRFSLVELPDGIADRVVKALRGATIRGNKVLVRRDRDA